jgi:hypothetical protein
MSVERVFEFSSRAWALLIMDDQRLHPRLGASVQTVQSSRKFKTEER